MKSSNNKGKIGCSGLIGGAVIVFIAFVVMAMISGNKSDENSSSGGTNSTYNTESSAEPAESKDETLNDKPNEAKTETTKPEEPTETETPEETEYPEMNGFLIGNSKGTVDSTGCTVTGIVGNATGQDCSYVSITIGFFDGNGNKITSGIDNVLNLASGETWKYTVIGIGSGIKKYQIEEIVWY